jgi:hypothetical protein
MRFLGLSTTTDCLRGDVDVDSSEKVEPLSFWGKLGFCGSSMERANITTQKHEHKNSFFGSSLTHFNLSDGSQIGRTPS